MLYMTRLAVSLWSMANAVKFDPTFDFRSEGGEDPDHDSPTLREYPSVFGASLCRTVTYSS